MKLNKIISMIGAILILWLMCISVVSAQEILGTPSIESNRYLIKLIKMERYGARYNEYKYTFVSIDKTTQQRSLIEMHNLTTQLRRIEIAGDLLIVFGEIRNTANVVTILDLKQAIEKDSILCYAPGLSKTKKYIIYLNYYPRFTEPPGTSNVVMIYNLLATPQENRINKEDVGRPIYPEENVKRKSARVWIEVPEKGHLIYPWGKYLWLDNDAKVVFVDKHAGENWLVLIDLSNGIDNVAIRKKRIDVEKIIAIDMKSPDYMNKLKKAKKLLMVNDIANEGNNKVRLDLMRDKIYKVTSITMELP